MIFKPTVAMSLTLLIAAAANAESRQLDAHQHGHGTLKIAVEGQTVLMVLEAPGADIVGFEHPAQTADDRALVESGIARLGKPLDLFVMPDAANCAVSAANVALLGEEEHEDGHKDGHDHSHDNDNADGHDDDHADEAAKEGHTEFHAEYNLTCTNPEAIDAIEFSYFEQFPNAVELDIEMISDKGAKGFEVERDEPRLSLAGAI